MAVYAMTKGELLEETTRRGITLEKDKVAKKEIIHKIVEWNLRSN